jgi:hypothetical protein
MTKTDAFSAEKEEAPPDTMTTTRDMKQQQEWDEGIELAMALFPALPETIQKRGANQLYTEEYKTWGLERWREVDATIRLEIRICRATIVAKTKGQIRTAQRRIRVLRQALHYIDIIGKEDLLRAGVW